MVKVPLGDNPPGHEVPAGKFIVLPPPFVIAIVNPNALPD